ncbi:MAG: DUF2341 domain-containing protein [Euryarchaeota archaeon]|nr:DUF2341 domain-containing protein [Euryarchaeota archaeon]
MKNNNFFKKSIIFALLFLFIGTSVLPSISTRVTMRNDLETSGNDTKRQTLDDFPIQRINPSEKKLGAEVKNDEKQGSLLVKLEAKPYKITENEKVESEIEMEGFGSILVPGCPKLPSKTFLIAVPPGGNVVSVDVVSENHEAIAGLYHIIPAPPIFNDKDIIENTIGENGYSSSDPYPSNVYEYLGMGQLRKYSFAQIQFSPIVYTPATGELQIYKELTLKITYEIGKKLSDEALSDTVMDDIASDILVNYQDMIPSYISYTASSRSQTYDYVIITNDSLESAVANLVNRKALLGYSVNVVTTSWISSIYSGVDLPEKIRNFLIENYVLWGIKYVLIVGNHLSIPMRYCYPDRTNHTHEVPTDYYYADLTGNWDSDGDGFYGERYDDNVDFYPEVWVGRIPVDNYNTVYDICEKIIDFDRNNESWKKNALLLGAILNYADEDGSGWQKTDSATLMEKCWSDILGPKGYSRTAMYETEGLSPSVYPCDYPLNKTNVLAQWPEGYGICTWDAHGNEQAAYQKVWGSDDGDGIPEKNETVWYPFIESNDSIGLNDDKPSIVFAVSCDNAYPEDPNNLGVSLLTKGAVSFVGATRLAWGTVGWANQNYGGCASIDYYYYQYLVNNGQKCGDALYNSKVYYINHFDWWGWQCYDNMYGFCLYGDPSVGCNASSKTLNVGGSGPGNYTHIYEAINAAQDGDTVFVYDDSSPYHESFAISKSIELIGENKETTIIDGYAGSQRGGSERIYVTADRVRISGFTIQNDGPYMSPGIYAISSNDTITGNIFANNYFGIMASGNPYDGGGFNCIFTDNMFISNDTGILLGTTYYCTIMNNTFTSGGISLFGESLLEYTSQVIEKNTINGRPIYFYKNINDVAVPSDAAQVILANCTNFTMQNLNLSGIDLCYSSYNRIVGSTVGNINFYGILLWHASNNVIDLNNISGSPESLESFETCGIMLSYLSDNNILSRNNISTCMTGIALSDGCNNNFISDCSFFNNSVIGLYFYGSGGTQVNNCSFFNGSIYIEGGTIENFMIQNFDNCTVNGKPFYYIKNSSEIDIPYDAGQIILVNCSNIQLSNRIFENVTSGVELAFSENVTINECIIKNYKYTGLFIYNNNNTFISNCHIFDDSLFYGTGIGLMESKNTIITGCSIYDNPWVGIDIRDPQENSDKNQISNCILTNNHNGIGMYNGKNYVIKNCVISNNSYDGIRMDNSNDNTLLENIVENNGENGISLEGESNNNTISQNIIKENNRGLSITTYHPSIYNQIYYNNFMNNTVNAYDYGTNIWNQSYPDGGNYWFDYTGMDANGDGIGDTPYNISGGSSQDLYPFMEQNGWLLPVTNFTYTPENPTPTDIIHFTDKSYDRDGTIVSWLWYFGDQNYSDLQNPIHCYYFDGVYNVNLTVTDNDGAQNTIHKTINVSTPNPPYTPNTPNPPNTATGVNIDADIFWTGGDPDPDDTVTYDVYFGSTYPPTAKVSSNQTANIYTPGLMSYNTTYYWNVIAWDNHGLSTTGPIWMFTTQPRPPWWNTNWQYYKTLNINNPNNDYQMKIIIGKSTSGNTTCNGHCKDDFTDIRFIDTDQTTELPYWIENFTSGQQATIWVKTPTDSQTDQKIIMYYDNPNATTNSNPNTTFLFYDDFTGTNLNATKWTRYTNGTTTCTVSSGTVALQSRYGNSNRQSIRSNTIFDTGIQLTFRYKESSPRYQGIIGASTKIDSTYAAYTDGSYAFANIKGGYSDPSRFASRSEGGSETSTTYSPSEAGDTWYVGNLKIGPNKQQYTRDNTILATHVTSLPLGSYKVHIGEISPWDLPYTLTIDYISVHKFADPEPQWGTIGMEIPQNTPPNSPAKPSGPNNGFTNMTYIYSTNTTDPEGDQIFYLFDWGDNSSSEWLGPYNSGEIICFNHSWMSQGYYQVKVKAKDIYDYVSEWSEPLTVFIVEGFYMNLNNFPMYPAIVTPGYREMCGPAVAQMALNYMWWNSSNYSTPPMTFDNQTWLYTTGYANNTDANISYLDTQGLWKLLQTYLPLPYATYGYNFAQDANTNQTYMLKQICTWINYTIGTYGGHKPGHPLNVPALVPTYGNYSNWMAVRGFHSDQPAYLLPSNLTIYGFWVNDPYPESLGGMGENSYKTITQWNTQYYQPLVSNDTYNGKYVAICEPPETKDQTVVTLGSSPMRFTMEQKQLIAQAQNLGVKVSLDIINQANQWIINAAIDGVNEQLIPYDPEFAATFTRTVAGVPLYVDNFNGADYYLVPFNIPLKKQVAEPLPIPLDPHQVIPEMTAEPIIPLAEDEVIDAEPILKTATTVVVIIDANDGSFKEASWTQEPVKYLPISKEDAQKIVLQTMKTSKGNAETFQKTTSELVYRESSPYYPDWKIIMNNKVIYVSQQGIIL